MTDYDGHHTGSTELQPFRDAICPECDGTLEWERTDINENHVYYCWNCGHRDQLVTTETTG